MFVKKPGLTRSEASVFKVQAEQPAAENTSVSRIEVPSVDVRVESEGEKFRAVGTMTVHLYHQGNPDPVVVDESIRTTLYNSETDARTAAWLIAQRRKRS